MYIIEVDCEEDEGENLMFVLVTVAPCIASLDMNMRKKIDNELIRSRNSMIKEIRREIREKITFAMKSQGV